MGPEAAVIAAWVGTGIQAVGALQSAGAAASAAKYNAEVDEQNAVLAEQSAEEDAKRSRREARLRIGTAVTNAAGSSLGLDGSALDAIYDSALQEELDIATIRYQGSVKAQGLKGSARLERSRARSEQAAGALSAAGALASGTGQALTLKRTT